MASVQVSIAVKNDISAILFLMNGKLIQKDVQKVRNYCNGNNTFTNLLSTIYDAMLKTRYFIEENPQIDTVVFEINNSTIQSWFDRCYAKTEYNDLFLKIELVLQSIPIKYDIIVSQKPKALMFADKKYVKAEQVSSLDSFIQDLDAQIS